MKKIISLLVVMIMTLTCNAQWYIGGNMGISSSKSTIKILNETSKTSSTTFCFAPDFGCELKDGWSIGMTIGYEHTGNTSYVIDDEEFNGMANSFSINPYVRYTFFEKGDFYAYCDGGIGYSNTHYNGQSYKMSNIHYLSIGINPGIGYSLTNHVSIEARFGDLSYNTSFYKLKTEPVVKIQDDFFNFGITNEITFGIYYNF